MDNRGVLHDVAWLLAQLQAIAPSYDDSSCMMTVSLTINE